MQREAAEIREEWLGWALSTLPADRTAAEAAISGLYHLIGLDPPRFHWVSSPVTALTTVPPGLRPRPSETIEQVAEWPLPRRLSALMSALSVELDRRFGVAYHPMDRLAHHEIRAPIRLSVINALLTPLRAAHDSPLHMRFAWYDVPCVSKVAHYDALRRLTGLPFTPEQTRQFELWATLARTCGWWWPREDVCVVSERPVAMQTEASVDERAVRLHHPDGPALRYADGWDVHAWHGTQVPPWVITDPTAWRITQEANVEVRRCAIERIGWASYIDQACLRPVASAPDPGNPDSQLHLYDMRKETRVLLAVNGSLERDGRRRRYGLTVPGFLNDPIAAAGWTYGLSAEQYSLLLRRT
ncbi:hypothetical protein GCM10027176_02380 [Actinoallomurus bryophytorum]|uniref:DUF6745 domain-containing protein n=1 Tax=Actinoallomurus bryophytorum TaxID=1490222 RepID=A0A543CK55_9ACTN|nr:hypothetical protein FB559_3072 [Actinoallomurus bryophytorum]